MIQSYIDSVFDGIEPTDGMTLITALEPTTVTVSRFINGEEVKETDAKGNTEIKLRAGESVTVAP